MNKLKIFLPLLLLLLSSFAFADLTTDNELYYSFDNADLSGSDPLDLTPNNNDGTNNGATTGATGIIDEAFDFDGVNDQVKSSDSFSLSSRYTVSLWANSDSLNSAQQMFDSYNSGAGSRIIFGYNRIESAELEIGMRTSTGWTFFETLGHTDLTWTHYVLTYDGTDIRLYIDGSQFGTAQSVIGTFILNETVVSGSASNNVAYYDGKIDELSVWNRALTAQEVADLYNAGSGLQYPYATSQNLTITAIDIFDSSTINTFNATVNGAFYNTTTGTITFPYLSNESVILNITVEAENYFPYQNESYNTSKGNLQVQLDTTRISVSYEDFKSIGGINYTRTLSYQVNVTNCFGDVTINRIINGSINQSTIKTCSNETTQLNGSYLHNQEGQFNISFSVNGVDSFESNTNNATFTADLQAPSIELSYTEKNTFDTNNQLTFGLFCNDTLSYDNNYNLTLNSNNIISGNFTVGSNQTTTEDATDGLNSLTGVCSDAFSSVNQTETFTVYAKTVILFDETTSAPLNLDNVTQARLYFGDNSSFYDFKAEAKTNVTVFAFNTTKIRVDLTYEDGAVIVRYIDVSFPEIPTEMRVCANKEGTTHYEQLILSSSASTKAVMQNAFNECYIAADNTRFAYQNSFVLKAFTIDTNYFLYTINTDDEQILLASIDGSIQTFLNIDTIQFSRGGLNLQITDDFLGTQVKDDSVEIYYINYAENNDAVNVKIYDTETNTLLLNTNSISDPNEFKLIFDTSTLNQNTSTLYKVVVTPTKDGETTGAKERFFNLLGDEGLFNSGFALMIGIGLLIFGLSIIVASAIFSWFGIVIGLAVIIIASLGVSVWYLTLLQMFGAILIVYSVINLMLNSSEGLV